MTLLIVYLTIALGFSFLCSIAEAVLLSVTTAYVRVLEELKKPSANRWQQLKRDIDTPLSAILSLNTIAHTVGAAGVGAQAAVVFGNQYLGLVSAILTLLILFFSEIIPKTLGSVYWRQLAPTVAFSLHYLVIVLYPFVWVSKFITRKISAHPTLEGFSRQEFAAMVNLGEAEGELDQQEARILQNFFTLRETSVSDIMTPNIVTFKLSETMTVDEYFEKYLDKRFTRIPLYRDSEDYLASFVLRSDLLSAKAGGKGHHTLSTFSRDIAAILDKTSLLSAFEVFVQKNAQIMHIVDEYGTLKGIVTLEDIVETLVGEEFVDEGDSTADLQQFARKRWLQRAERMGININEFK
ncbi:MAG: CNNM domain-containing protein [Cellvibrionaceae bacterium]